MKRTFIPSRGDRPRRNDMKTFKIHYVFQPQLDWSLGRRANSSRERGNDLLLWSAGEDAGRWEPWLAAGRSINGAAVLKSNMAVWT